MQMQRRAIEDVRPQKATWPKGTLGIARKLPKPHFHLTNRRKLFFYGISYGLGTCSGIHGMNVAVLGLDSPGVKTCRMERRELYDSEYFVLLTHLSDAEKANVARHNRVPVSMAVELLHCRAVRAHTGEVAFVFEKSGRIARYVNLI